MYEEGLLRKRDAVLCACKQRQRDVQSDKQGIKTPENRESKYDKFTPTASLRSMHAPMGYPIRSVESFGSAAFVGLDTIFLALP